MRISLWKGLHRFLENLKIFEPAFRSTSGLTLDTFYTIPSFFRSNIAF